MRYLIYIILLFPIYSYAAETDTCIVNYIVDGDTIDCTFANGEIERIRFIGVNSPEKNTEAGKRAKAFTSTYCPIRSKITLEYDVQRRGPYRRTLAYVWLNKKTMFNNLLVKEGFAQVATYPPNVRYVDLFIKSEQDARANNRGLWKQD